MWSMIQAANAQEEALPGLERLARAYWRPLYVFSHQRGMDHEAASDAVQGFFEHLISTEMLEDVRRGAVPQLSAALFHELARQREQKSTPGETWWCRGGAADR
jgi:hypothetical protein